MTKYEVYVGNDNRLRVVVFDESLQGHMLMGNDAYYCIRKLYNCKILSAKDNDVNAILRFNDCLLTINDYNKIFENYEFIRILMPILINFKKYEEKRKINDIKKKKVKRENKYGIKKVIVSGLLTFVVGVTSISGLSALGDKNKKSDIFIDNFHTQFVVENNKISDFYGDESIDLSITLDDEQENDVNYSNEESTKQCAYISFEDRTETPKAKKAANDYSSVIEKYSNIYGLDKNLILAIATQETGDHYNYVNNGYAVGLMQVEKKVWNNKPLTAYNFDTNTWETITVNGSKLSDLDYNVKVGCMIFQLSLRDMNYNILCAIQNYNMGYGNMHYKIIPAYCADTNKTKDEVLNDQYDIGWIEYRNLAKGGDQNYIENVLSYIGKKGEINIIKPDGESVSLNVASDEKEKMY